MFGVFPLLALVLAAYNAIAFFAGEKTSDILTQIIINKPMQSGAVFTLAVEEILIIIALFLLFFEVFKSTRASDTTILEHFLSLLVFLTFLLEFIFWDKLTCASFLIVGLMSLLDVVSGFTISITAARRDIGLQR